MTCPFENMKDILKGGGVRAVSSNQLFATPAHIVEKMIDYAALKAGMSILEPSAGTGAIIRQIPNDCSVTAIEINPELCKRLLVIGNKENTVLNCDFMDLHLVRESRYDRILMNPPFSNGADIKHIKRALQWLKDGGRLVAICANGSRQQREIMPICTHWEDLPHGTFKQSGTMVNTAILTIDN